MNKPEWKDAPEWAGYLAQDGCGAWYWFEYKPKHGSQNNWYVTYGDCQEAIYNADWGKTMEQRK